MKNTLLIEKSPIDFKSFFMYLFMLITFYIVFPCLLALLFDYVNFIYIDTFDSYAGTINSIRWNIAVLVILYPSYVYVFLKLKQALIDTPEQTELSIRKFSIYFTIFIAALVICSVIIFLIYYFLNGELNTRFILKACITFILSASIFYFFWRELKSSWTIQQLKILSISISFFIIACIGYGLYIAGSPTKVRQMKFDSIRVRDLNYIQSKIVEYWISKQQLPSDLNRLTDNLSGTQAPTDPQSHQPYHYRVLSPLSFELCATFNFPSFSSKGDKLNPYVDMQMQEAIQIAFRYSLNKDTWNWQHDKGKYCYTRTIDPTRYAKHKS